MMDEYFNGMVQIIGLAKMMNCSCYGDEPLQGTYILRNIMLKEFTAGSTHGEQSTRKANAQR